MHRLLPCLLFAGVLSSAPGEETQKRIIADFEDVGTWRVVEAHGCKPDAWFAGGMYLDGSRAESRHDRYVGEAKFAFDPASPGPYSVAFQRKKAMLVSGFLDGIEFDADANGFPLSVCIVLGDTAGKKFTSNPVPLATKKGWQTYRIDLSTGMPADFSHCKFPAHLERIVVEADKACEGSMFFDDVTLTGDFARSDRVSIFPITDDIALTPGKEGTLQYRLRNANPAPLPVTTRIEVRNFGGMMVYKNEQTNTIPAYGQAMVPFALPALPIGAYAAAVTVDTGSFQVNYDDPFGVFVPNGKQLNHHAMWFGINSFATWQGEGMFARHLDLMRQLGINLDRIDASDRFEPALGVFTFDAWRRIFAAYAAAGIDIQLLYDSTPAWTQTSSRDYRAVPQDEAAYSRHVAEVGNFLKDFPSVRYIEFWNEPDIGTSPQQGFFHGDLPGFLKMFHLFSQAMRAAAPNLKIVSAGTCVIHPHERPGFSEALIKQGAPDYDLAAFHAHGPVGNYQERELLVEKWMKEAGINKPICNTETGERSTYDPAGRAAQAITLMKKIVYAKSRPETEFYEWFTLQDYWDMDPNTDDSFGLVTSDNRIKPSFIAYNALIHELADTVPLPEVSLGDNIETYAFRRENGSVVYACWPKPGVLGAVVWLKNGGQPITQVDLFGANEILPSIGDLVPVSLGTLPVYLETATGAAPLAASDADAGFVQVASEVRFDPSAPGTFPVKVRNPGKDVMNGVLNFEDSEGKSLWSQAISLAPGNTAQFEVAVPPVGEEGDAENRSGAITLQMDGAGAPRFRFSLMLVPTYSIRRSSGNPLVSDVSDFVQHLPVLSLQRQQDVVELAFDPTIPPWGGPTDLSIQARLCHDGTGLYFRFDVTDDKQVQNGPAEKLWNGDSVQVAVASGDNPDYTIFNLGLLKEGPVAWCTDSPDPAQEGRWNIPLKIERQGTVTTYQAYVPFSQLGLTVGDAAQPIRFSFLVNENDGQGRVRYMHWYDGIEKGRDLNLLGYGTLEGK